VEHPVPRCGGPRIGIVEERASVSAEESLRYATVLVEIGDLYDAELTVAEVLERSAESLTALDLLAKIKHIRGEARIRFARSMVLVRPDLSSPEARDRHSFGRDRPELPIESARTRKAVSSAQESALCSAVVPKLWPAPHITFSSTGRSHPCAACMAAVNL